MKAGKEGDSILLEATEGGISVMIMGKYPEEEISRVTEAFYMVLDKSEAKKREVSGWDLPYAARP